MSPTRCGNGAMCGFFRLGNTTSIRHPVRLLSTVGWNSPDLAFSGQELIESYLEPLANRTQLARHIQTSRTRDGDQPNGWIRQGENEGPGDGAF